MFITLAVKTSTETLRLGLRHVTSQSSVPAAVQAEELLNQPHRGPADRVVRRQLPLRTRWLHKVPTGGKEGGCDPVHVFQGCYEGGLGAHT